MLKISTPRRAIKVTGSKPMRVSEGEDALAHEEESGCPGIGEDQAEGTRQRGRREPRGREQMVVEGSVDRPVWQELGSVAGVPRADQPRLGALAELAHSRRFGSEELIHPFTVGNLKARGF